MCPLKLNISKCEIYLITIILQKISWAWKRSIHKSFAYSIVICLNPVQPNLLKSPLKLGSIIQFAVIFALNPDFLLLSLDTNLMVKVRYFDSNEVPSGTLFPQSLVLPMSFIGPATWRKSLAQPSPLSRSKFGRERLSVPFLLLIFQLHVTPLG